MSLRTLPEGGGHLVAWRPAVHAPRCAAHAPICSRASMREDEQVGEAEVAGLRGGQGWGPAGDGAE